MISSGSIAGGTSANAGNGLGVAGGTPFIPVPGQSFKSKREWIVFATRRLTSHPEYNNTEHGDTKGWRGAHFTAMCFDQLGRRVRNGGDFQRAEDDNAYPVWWIWPDQIATLLMPAPTPQEARHD